ncbi:hypothetical protein [Ascidiimonas sp. W6]|uniref:hypothetical protein n=1 Tax=Ascidiimonas meishanensis TaxID=3128903 RepID=UPI0030EE58A2
MLLNISYNQPEVTRKIDNEVGKPFTLRERWRLGGVGSPKLHITTSSIDIHNLLVLDNNSDTCNVEIRPNGIIIRFRSLLETFALIIPFYKLSLYKGDSHEYSMYRDHYFIKVRADKKVHAFMKKVLNYKSEMAPTHIEDL